MKETRGFYNLKSNAQADPFARLRTLAPCQMRKKSSVIPMLRVTGLLLRKEFYADAKRRNGAF
ncbi:MAG: hypothetical protein P4L75_04600, partial [Clostridia bacterium]|nr:hypothetical protein [Clostridia bacterium]